MFGDLTHLKKKREINVLEYLFRNTNNTLSKFEVNEQEYKTAFERLNKLTSQLQVKRLRYKSKNACKYFML